MKKSIMILAAVFFMVACSDEEVTVQEHVKVPSGGVTDNISGQDNQFGALYDKRLSFFDYNGDNIPRDIPNNLSDT